MIEIAGEQYMMDKEASLKYGLSRSWFQKHRAEKTGPSYLIFNKTRVYYSVSNLDKWFKDNMKGNE